MEDITFDSNDFVNRGELESIYQSLKDNFSTHTNITSVTVIQGIFKSELENGTRFFGTDGIYVIKDEEDNF